MSKPKNALEKMGLSPLPMAFEPKEVPQTKKCLLIIMRSMT